MRVVGRSLALSVAIGCLIALNGQAVAAQFPGRGGPPHPAAAPRPAPLHPTMMARPGPNFARPAMPAHNFARPSMPAHTFSAPSFARRNVGSSFAAARAAPRSFAGAPHRSAGVHALGARNFARSSAGHRFARHDIGRSRLAQTQRMNRAARLAHADRGRGRLAHGDRATLRADRLARHNGANSFDRNRAQSHSLANFDRHGTSSNLATRAATFGAANRLAAARTFDRHNWHHDWRHHRGRFFGWVGPLFWPYAYDDVFYDTVWGYGFDEPGVIYEDPFWSYGYADIYGGLFSPYGYDDMLAMAPSGRSARRGARVASRTGGDNEAAGAAGAASGWKQMCGDDSRAIVGLPIDRIRDVVQPNESQSALLDALGNASVQAAQAVKAACPSDYSLTPSGRMAAMEQRLRGLRQAVDIMAKPLDDFFASLTDEQKARLNAVGQDPATQNARIRANSGLPAGSASIVQDCAAASATTEWPTDRLERALRPNETQREALTRLRDAAAQAADTLAKSCPQETPTTPPARLAAIAKRLDAMIAAVATVRTAVNDVYGTLSDEQKAQFNTIGQATAR